MRDEHVHLAMATADGLELSIEVCIMSRCSCGPPQLMLLMLSVQVRTSTGMFFEPAADEVISKIEERVALVTMLPKGM